MKNYRNHWKSLDFLLFGDGVPPPQFFKKEKKLLLNQRQIQDEATPSPINKNHAIKTLKMYLGMVWPLIGNGVVTHTITKRALLGMVTPHTIPNYKVENQRNPKKNYVFVLKFAE